jgi:hypothetical protein
MKKSYSMKKNHILFHIVLKKIIFHSRVREEERYNNKY